MKDPNTHQELQELRVRKMVDCSFFGNPDWFRPENNNKWLEGKWLAKKK